MSCLYCCVRSIFIIRLFLYQVPLAAGGHMNMLSLTNTDAADFEFSGLYLDVNYTLLFSKMLSRWRIYSTVHIRKKVHNFNL